MLARCLVVFEYFTHRFQLNCSNTCKTLIETYTDVIGNRRVGGLYKDNCD